jgi:hypothetical protein
MDHFEVFRINVEVQYEKISAGCLFNSFFQEVSIERVVDCYENFLDEVPCASQIKEYAFA